MYYEDDIVNEDYYDQYQDDFSYDKLNHVKQQHVVTKTQFNNHTRISSGPIEKSSIITVMVKKNDKIVRIVNFNDTNNSVIENFVNSLKKDYPRAEGYSIVL